MKGNSRRKPLRDVSNNNTNINNNNNKKSVGTCLKLKNNKVDSHSDNTHNKIEQEEDYSVDRLLLLHSDLSSLLHQVFYSTIIPVSRVFSIFQFHNCFEFQRCFCNFNCNICLYMVMHFYFPLLRFLLMDSI